MLQNWGEMTKAQDDATTIDEAIASAISAHEADPESHMGPDESIENHRKNEIVDHPAGSVLADKGTMSELAVSTDFGTLAGWTTSGDLDNGFWPGVRIGSNYPSTAGTKLIAQEGFCEQVFDLSKDFLFETALTISDSDYATFFVGVSNADYPVSGNTFFGFKLVNGVMRGVFGKGATLAQTAQIAVDLSALHVYRANYIASEQLIYFYCDGELVQTIDLSAESGTAVCYFRINLKESSENYVTIFIYYFRVSRQL